MLAMANITDIIINLIPVDILSSHISLIINIVGVILNNPATPEAISADIIQGTSAA